MLTASSKSLIIKINILQYTFWDKCKKGYGETKVSICTVTALIRLQSKEAVRGVVAFYFIWSSFPDKSTCYLFLQSTDLVLQNYLSFVFYLVWDGCRWSVLHGSDSLHFWRNCCCSRFRPDLNLHQKTESEFTAYDRRKYRPTCWVAQPNSKTPWGSAFMLWLVRHYQLIYTIASSAIMHNVFLLIFARNVYINDVSKNIFVGWAHPTRLKIPIALHLLHGLFFSIFAD